MSYEDPVLWLFFGTGVSNCKSGWSIISSWQTLCWMTVYCSTSKLPLLFLNLNERTLLQIISKEIPCFLTLKNVHFSLPLIPINMKVCMWTFFSLNDMTRAIIQRSSIKLWTRVLFCWSQKEVQSLRFDETKNLRWI